MSDLSRPNIIFILLDDVGWNPARAALLTGRYSVNAGIPYILLPGSPAGLKLDAETLPSTLKSRAGYRTAMAGKWHLGHAQQQQTPVGRGFDEFTGLYMWDSDSFSKQVYMLPWKPMMIDWVQEFANGTFRHFAEPSHSTEAITANAEDMMRRHAGASNGAPNSNLSDPDPLFLYVAYTAAHSPLQPLARHVQHCAHVTHYWRRQFCGMVVGVDEGVKNLTATAIRELGPNTIMVVTSDNGGSPWFGGMNQPFRGGKTTPYEGGVKVPAFIVDFSEGAQYLQPHQHHELHQRQYQQQKDKHQQEAEKKQQQQQLGAVSAERRAGFLMHVCDWMPTLLHLAGVPVSAFPQGMDGIDMLAAIRGAASCSSLSGDASTACDASSSRSRPASSPNSSSSSNVITSSDSCAIGEAVAGLVAASAPGPRSEMLLELLTAEDAVFGEDLFAYREGDWKLVHGYPRDPGHYSESSADRLNFTNRNWVSLAGEAATRLLEPIFSEAPFDTFRVIIAHRIVHSSLVDYSEPITKLFNLGADPQELVNVADQHAEDVQRIMAKIDRIRLARPAQPTYRLQYPLDTVWPKTFVSGDCSMNPAIAPKNCKFTHPWVPDSVDPWADPALVDSVEFLEEKLQVVPRLIVAIVALLAIVMPFLVDYWMRRGGGSAHHRRRSADDDL